MKIQDAVVSGRMPDVKDRRNLRWREGKWYLDKWVGGQRFVHVLSADYSKAIQERNAFLKASAAAVHNGKMDELRAIYKPQSAVQGLDGLRCAKLGVICRRYLAIAQARGEPSVKSAENNVRALALVVRRGLGVSEWEDQEASVLTPDLLLKFRDVLLAEAEDAARGRRSAGSLIRQARCVFKRNIRQELEAEGVVLPLNFQKFLEFSAVSEGRVDRAKFSEREIEIIRSGCSLKESRPDLYAVWFLGYFCALRAGEMENARKDWLRKETVSGPQLQGADWLRALGRDWCWVLDIEGSKTEASKAMIPLADDVAEELARICGGSRTEFILPGDTPTDRLELSHRGLSGWFRDQGWQRVKTTHELRAYRQQVWAAVHGFETSERWVRHAVRGVAADYLGRLPFHVSRRPLGLGE